MSGFTRPRKAAPSAVNVPTAVHISSSSILTKSEAESILSEFISTSESITATIPGSSDDDVSFSTTGLSNSSGSNAIIAQLKRVQRDLRGLPPLLAELGIATIDSSNTYDQNKGEQPVNKKIKFDDSSDETNSNNDDANIDEPSVINSEE